ncbi:hypothetical protein SAMN05216327_109125 [Dyadobacter sp. SG02]|uniref:hypothetical protein n=1 Tax=Dyadobacter sp. SG02 TaxID=1855291 RepID=UPI0008D31EE4|nr:hypothetical protein [Dyadobacter sp. SG02]SEJ37804.1 hypothetical protein SAMN05216327_109125 [Dyadobacter sp. SG02]
MKTSTLFSAFVLTVGLAASSVSFAQVKIGSNPTTIDPNNNLEVEASTPGRKTSINKTTGQVTITDGTQGAGKVFTSDANGGGSWQTSGAGCASFDAKGDNTTTPVVNTGVYTPVKLIANNVVYSPSGAYDSATGEYTIPENGFYIFHGSVGTYNVAIGTTGSRNTSIDLVSASKGLLSHTVSPELVYGVGAWQDVTSANYFTAGDKVTFQINSDHVSGVKPDSVTTAAIFFSGTRIDCNKN